MLRNGLGDIGYGEEEYILSKYVVHLGRNRRCWEWNFLVNCLLSIFEALNSPSNIEKKRKSLVFLVSGFSDLSFAQGQSSLITFSDMIALGAYKVLKNDIWQTVGVCKPKTCCFVYLMCLCCVTFMGGVGMGSGVGKNGVPSPQAEHQQKKGTIPHTVNYWVTCRTMVEGLPREGRVIDRKVPHGMAYSSLREGGIKL